MVKSSSKKGTDGVKNGSKGKGTEKLDLQEQLCAQEINFYADPDNMDYEENATNDEHPNPKKRKGTDDDNSATSDEEFVATEQDPILIQNLINQASESNAKYEEMERVAQVQAAKLRLLA